MNDSKEIRILVYSLKMVADFSEKVDSITSGKEFLTIHNRNIDSLRQLSIARETSYFANRIKEYPELTEIELDEFIKQKRKEKSLFTVLGGWFFMLLELLYKTAKTRGGVLGRTKSNLKLITTINTSLIHIVENPGMEELVMRKN